VDMKRGKIYLNMTLQITRIKIFHLKKYLINIRLNIIQKHLAILVTIERYIKAKNKNKPQMKRTMMMILKTKIMWL
jgi:UDP-N-acetylmuramoylalanine-D-glutamate ligase